MKEDIIRGVAMSDLQSKVANQFAEELARIGKNFFSKIQPNDLGRFSLSSTTGGSWEVNGPVFADFEEAKKMAKKYGTYPVCCQTRDPYISSESDHYTLYFQPVYASVSTWYEIGKCDPTAMAIVSNVLSRDGLDFWMEEWYDGYYKNTSDPHRMSKGTIVHL